MGESKVDLVLVRYLDENGRWTFKELSRCIREYNRNLGRGAFLEDWMILEAAIVREITIDTVLEHYDGIFHE